MREFRVAGVLLGCAVIAAGLAFWGSERVGASPHGSCAYVTRSYATFRWSPLRPGDRLGPFDAIITCESGRAVLKAPSTAFPRGVDHWFTRDGDLTTIGEERFLVIGGGVAHDSGESYEVEVVEVVGSVFYSREREAIRALDYIGRATFTPDEVARYWQPQWDDLALLRWEPLREGRVLGPWDMLWTGPGGRSEIELLDPPLRGIDPWTAVVDATGQPTGRNRFMSNTRFVMVPSLYRSARVTKIIGDVWIASDPNQVKAYFERYPNVLNHFPLPDKQALREWKAMLRKPELE